MVKLSSRAGRAGDRLPAGKSPRRQEWWRPFVDRGSQAPWDRLALAAIGVGVVVRAVVILGLHRPDGYIYSDMQGYVSGADQVVAGVHSPVLAIKPPGVQLLLAAAFELFGTGRPGHMLGADVLWFVLSSLVPLLAWRLVRTLFDDPITAALTAAFCAAYPIFIGYGAFFTTETPTLLFLCGSLWLGYRARLCSSWRSVGLALAAGLLGGALVATRPQFLLNLGLLLLAMLRQWRVSWRAIVGLSVGFLIVFAATVAVDTQNAGHLSEVGEESGIQFFQAQCSVHEVFTGANRSFSYDAGSPVSFQLDRGKDYHFPNTLFTDQGFFYDQGLKCIHQHGLGQIGIEVRNVSDLTVTSIMWPLVSEIGLSRVADVTNVVYCFVLAVSLLVIWRRWRRQEITGQDRWGLSTLLWQLAMVIPVTVPFGTEPRYRVPYDIFGLAIIAWLLAQRVRSGVDEALGSQPASPKRAPAAATRGAGLRRRR